VRSSTRTTAPSPPDRVLGFDEAIRRLRDEQLARGHAALVLLEARRRVDLALEDGLVGPGTRELLAACPPDWRAALVRLDAFADALVDVELAMPALRVVDLLDGALFRSPKGHP
jgi:hypothetical protein